MLTNISNALLNRTDCSFLSSSILLYEKKFDLSDPAPLTLKNGGQKFVLPGVLFNQCDSAQSTALKFHA